VFVETCGKSNIMLCGLIACLGYYIGRESLHKNLGKLLSMICRLQCKILFCIVDNTIIEWILKLDTEINKLLE
jgi:hypothetical protein